MRGKRTRNVLTVVAGAIAVSMFFSGCSFFRDASLRGDALKEKEAQIAATVAEADPRIVDVRTVDIVWNGSSRVIYVSFKADGDEPFSEKSLKRITGAVWRHVDFSVNGLSLAAWLSGGDKMVDLHQAAESLWPGESTVEGEGSIYFSSPEKLFAGTNQEPIQE